MSDQSEECDDSPDEISHFDGTDLAHDFLAKVRALWSPTVVGPQYDELLSLIKTALSKYPYSAELWCLLGDAIQISQWEISPDPPPAYYYQNALKCDPFCGNAYQELGMLAWVHDNYADAETYLKLARECGAPGADSDIGLAKVYQEQGMNGKAQDVLREGRDVFQRLVNKLNEAASEIA